MNTPPLAAFLSCALFCLPLIVMTLLPLMGLKKRLGSMPGRMHFLLCFLNALMITAFCRLYAKLLTAPAEMSAGHGALLPLSALACFGLAVLYGVFFFKTFTVKIPALLAEPALSRIWRYVMPVPMLLSVLFLWVSPREAAVVMTGRVRITTMLFLTIVPPVLWFFYHAAWWIMAQLAESARIREENNLLQIEGKRYRELREYMDETRALRHDFRQHLNAISGLAQTGQNEKLIAYLTEYTQTISETKTAYCKNKTVDALAAHYDSIAASQDSFISWTLELPEELPLPETDYCVMLGNLTENALRAVKKIPQNERHITVTSKMLSEAMLGLSVKNPYSGTVQFDRTGLPLPARAGHGIGLQSVRNTAEKYHGSVEIAAEDGSFSVMVICMTATL